MTGSERSGTKAHESVVGVRRPAASALARLPLWWQFFIQDARYTVRFLRRNPGAATVVTLTLALAIGVNTAIFSVFNAVLLKPLTFPDADRLVAVETPEVGAPRDAAAVVFGPDFVGWRDQTTLFEHFVAYGAFDYTLLFDDNARQARMALVTNNFWQLAGARTALGRLPKDDERGVIVLSSAFYERELRSDPNVIGRPVRVDGRQLSVIGVLPRDFQLQLRFPSWPGFEPREIAGFMSLMIEGENELLMVAGKLKSGVEIESAVAELETIRERVVAARPTQFMKTRLTQTRVRVRSLQDHLLGPARLGLQVMMVAAALVMLIACASIANLLLARASTRQREVAVRTSMGAGRARILGQLAVETSLLSIAGGVIGLLFARWSTDTITRLFPDAVPRLQETTLDLPVLAFTIAIMILTTFVCGVFPTLFLWKVNPAAILGSGTRTSSTRDTIRTRRILVAAEVSVAVVLLSAAGLLGKSFWQMSAHPDGFHPEEVLMMKVPLSGPRYRALELRRVYIDEALARVEGLPGVSAASVTTHGDFITTLSAAGTPLPSPEELAARPPTLLSATSAQFRHVMGMQMIRGRWLTDSETAPVVVVNERLARRDFPGQDPVGRRVQVLGLESTETGAWAIIVGVVSDRKYSKLDASPEPEVFIHYRQAPELLRFTLLVRASGGPAAVASTVRRAVSDIDKSQPVYDIMTLDRALSDSVTARRFGLFTMASFAALALVLALVGIYGVVAYAAAQRTGEMGVRMALGAQRSDVVRIMVRQGMETVLAGMGIGLIAALALTRVIKDLLFDVEAIDPATHIVVLIVLAATTLLACLGPALRVALADPVAALRDH